MSVVLIGCVDEPLDGGGTASLSVGYPRDLRANTSHEPLPPDQLVRSVEILRTTLQRRAETGPIPRRFGRDYAIMKRVIADAERGHPSEDPKGGAVSKWPRAVALACAGVAMTGSLGVAEPVAAAPHDTNAREVARVLSISPTTPPDAGNGDGLLPPRDAATRPGQRPPTLGSREASPDPVPPGRDRRRHLHQLHAERLDIPDRHREVHG